MGANMTFSGGTLNATGFGTGNVSNSGTPATDELAYWVTSTSIKGVSLQTHRTNAQFWEGIKVKNSPFNNLLQLVANPTPGPGFILGVDATSADTNVSMAYESKGSGVHAFRTGGGTYTQFQINHQTTAGTVVLSGGDGAGNIVMSGGASGNFVTIANAQLDTGSRIIGVTNGSSAVAGMVGEYVVANLTTGALPTGATGNVTTFALSAGDWDVWANPVFQQASAANTYVTWYLSPTSATADNTHGRGTYTLVPPSNIPNGAVLMSRFVSSTSFNVYFVAQAVGATINLILGQIMARRRR